MAKKIQTPALRALQRAIGLAGGRRELARRICDLGYPHRDPRNSALPPDKQTPAFSSQRIDNWLSRDGFVPVEAAPYVSAAVGGRVTLRELCPQYRNLWSLLRQLLVDGNQIEGHASDDGYRNDSEHDDEHEFGATAQH